MIGKLTAAQCAALVGVAPRTWSAYVARDQAPAPLPGFDPGTGLRVWDEATVRAWMAARPGKSGRPRKVSPT